MPTSFNHRDALVPSPLYSGERVRVRGSSWSMEMRPLTPALSPEYRGEGVMRLVLVALMCVALASSKARAAEPEHYTFRNHVQPVLAKFGCSSGACHGAAAGQNGFRLSLRGYDDMGDWRSLTRGA